MRRGFTLLEMMVATLILAIAVAGALAAFAIATRATGQSERIQTAALLAQRRLTDLELNAAALSGGDQQGDFGEQFPEYRWRQSVVPTSFPNLFQVTVTIAWGTANSVSERSFTTYLRTDQDQINQQIQQQNQQALNAAASGGAGAGGGALAGGARGGP